MRQSSQDMNSAVLEAIEKGDVVKLRKILKSHPAILHNYLVDSTLLHWAADQDNVDVVALLVEAGIDVNAPREEYAPGGSRA